MEEKVPKTGEIMSRISQIFVAIQAVKWVEKLHANWLLEFLDVVDKNHAKAADGDLKAKTRIAWYFGQLVTPPAWIRDDEADRRRRRKNALARRRRGNDFVYVPDPVGRSEVEDQKATNRLGIKILRAYGVFNLMQTTMAGLHRADSENPLFTEEAWPVWRHWAQAFVFNKRRRPRRARRERRATERAA